MTTPRTTFVGGINPFMQPPAPAPVKAKRTRKPPARPFGEVVADALAHVLATPGATSGSTGAAIGTPTEITALALRKLTESGQVSCVLTMIKGVYKYVYWPPDCDPIKPQITLSEKIVAYVAAHKWCRGADIHALHRSESTSIILAKLVASGKLQRAGSGNKMRYATAGVVEFNNQKRSGRATSLGHGAGAEIKAMRDAGVTWSDIATMYPFNVRTLRRAMNGTGGYSKKEKK